MIGPVSSCDRKECVKRDRPKRGQDLTRRSAQSYLNRALEEDEVVVVEKVP